jgi:hypothetical protein
MSENTNTTNTQPASAPPVSATAYPDRYEVSEMSSAMESFTGLSQPEADYSGWSRADMARDVASRELSKRDGRPFWVNAHGDIRRREDTSRMTLTEAAARDAVEAAEAAQARGFNYFDAQELARTITFPNGLSPAERGRYLAQEYTRRFGVKVNPDA